jgi:hypothetical protein
MELQRTPPDLSGPVYTIDGHLLGHVAGVTDDSLHLKRRFRKDIWLSRDSILPAPWDGRTVTLFGIDVRDRYCRSTPNAVA